MYRQEAENTKTAEKNYQGGYSNRNLSSTSNGISINLDVELRNNRRNYRKQENFAEVDRVAMSFKYHQKVFLSSYCTIGICATVINIKDNLSSIENLNQMSPFIRTCITLS